MCVSETAPSACHARLEVDYTISMRGIRISGPVIKSNCPSLDNQIRVSTIGSGAICIRIKLNWNFNQYV